MMSSPQTPFGGCVAVLFVFLEKEQYLEVKLFTEIKILNEKKKKQLDVPSLTLILDNATKLLLNSAGPDWKEIIKRML